MKIKVEIEITEEQITDIIVGALEGGINYWCQLDTESETYKNAKEVYKELDLCTSELVSKIILDGGEVYFIDTEVEDKSYRLTLVKVLKGIKMNYIKRPFDCDLNNADSITYDCIIQYGLFGKIIYG